MDICYLIYIRWLKAARHFLLNKNMRFLQLMQQKSVRLLELQQSPMHMDLKSMPFCLRGSFYMRFVLF